MAAKLMPITGQVLDDALQDAQLSRRDAADRLGVSGADLDAWIHETRSPNAGQFKDLVKLLGCTPSYLFLPTPPPRSKTSVAFRTFPDSPVRTIPPDTAAAIDLARKVQRGTAWIAEQAETETRPPVPTASLADNPEEVASRLRVWLDWSIREQTSSEATDTSAAKAMRAALQWQGVTVLHLTMDEGVTRGFSLNDGRPVIAVNTRDHVRARLFSYAHELGHVALRDASICLTHNDQGVEGFCNRIAAAILMPEATFRTAVTDKVGGRVKNRENVVTIRNYFKVSTQAAAIRAETLGLAPGNLYKTIEYEAEAKSHGGRYVPGNERTRPRVRVDQYGFGFVNALLDAEESGALKHNQVLDILRLSDRELETARGLAMTGANE